MSRTLSVSGIMPVYNLRVGHYPFVETILMTLPLVDEFLINDGGSTDGTLEVLKKLEKTYPKIRVIEISHRECSDYSTMDRALEKVLRMTKGDWVIETQADEWFHPEDHQKLLNEIKVADGDGINSLRSPFYIIWGWTSCKEEDDDSVPGWFMRVFKNQPGIVTSWGGDGWYIEGQESVAEGYTLANLPPERHSTVPRYHAPIPMPASNLGKAVLHASTYAIEKSDRLKVLRRAKEREASMMKTQGPSWLFAPRQPVFHRLPKLMHPLKGWHFYEIREELFDPGWVAEQMEVPKEVLQQEKASL